MNLEPWDPQFLAMREMAVTQAIDLNRHRYERRQQRHLSLFDYPMVEPTPEELRVVRQCHARAKALGLTLPPFPKTTVQFVDAPDALQGGQTRLRDGVIEMAFPSGRPLESLRHVCLHELAHVHQNATGVYLTIEAAEHQAESFAWNAGAGWKPA